MNRTRARVTVCQILETIFSRAAALCEAARESVAVCPDCGRNRYSGPPCITLATNEAERVKLAATLRAELERLN